MKYSLRAASVVALATLALIGCNKVNVANKSELTTDDDKLSYGTGQKIASDLKNYKKMQPKDSAAVKIDDILQGIQDQLDTTRKGYQIGVQIGMYIKGMNQQMTAVGAKVDPAIVMQAIKESLADSAKSAQMLSETNARGIEKKIQEKFMAKQQEMMQKSQADAAKNDSLSKAEAENNKKAGAEFLAKNKAAAGVKTTASGLQYQVLAEGKGAKATESDTVKVKYTGSLISGQVFDSSADKPEGAVSFPVGAVIKGWIEALKMMSPGSKIKIVVPPELGYGDKAMGDKIPANSVLVFEMELLEVKKAK
jgi:FKBP-type peptidyl-prolyl cis-trans isomerase FkpA